MTYFALNGMQNLKQSILRVHQIKLNRFGVTVCRPMLSDRCLSVSSVTLVYCGQTVRWIKMKLGMQLGLDSGHSLLDGDPAPHPQSGTDPQFTVHICCGQMAGWIKMSLGREVRLSPSDIVLDGEPAPPQRRGTVPQF